MIELKDEEKQPHGRSRTESYKTEVLQIKGNRELTEGKQLRLY